MFEINIYKVNIDSNIDTRDTSYVLPKQKYFNLIKSIISLEYSP